MGAREPRASPLRPQPPPSSPELGGGGGWGRPRRPQTLVEPKDTTRGREWGRPEDVPAAGSGTSGGRRPGHAERPEGQVLGGRSGAPRGGGRRQRQRRGDAARPRGGVSPRPRVDADGDPRCAARLGDTAGGPSPALASWKPRVGARPPGRRDLRARTETALPLIRPDGQRPVRVSRARAEGRGAGSRSSAASGAAPRRGRSLPHLCVCRPAPPTPEDFRERLGTAFPACEARRGWMSSNMIIH